MFQQTENITWIVSIIISVSLNPLFVVLNIREQFLETEKTNH